MPGRDAGSEGQGTSDSDELSQNVHGWLDMYIGIYKQKYQLQKKLSKKVYL